MNMRRLLSIHCLVLLAGLCSCATRETDVPDASLSAPSPVAEEQALVGEVTKLVTAEELTGTGWTLAAWSLDEAARQDPLVTLSFAEDRISGSSGCNSYFASVSAGEGPGALQIGPMGATKKMCAPRAMEVEQRFSRLLSGAVTVGLIGDQLAVTAGPDGERVTMLFERAEDPTE